MIGLKIFCPRLSGKKNYQIFYKCLKIKRNFGYLLAILAKNSIKRQNTLFFWKSGKILIKFFLRQSWTKYLRPTMIFMKMNAFDRQDFQQIDQF